MRDPRRLLLPLFLVLAALAPPALAQEPTGAPTPAQQDAAADAAQAEAGTAKPEGAAQQKGALDAVDAFVGKVNGAIATVFFYDVGGKSASTSAAAGGAPRGADLQVLIDALHEQARFDLGISSVTLTLPAGTSDAVRDEVGAEFRALWAAKAGVPVADSAKTLDVAVAKEGTANATLAATRSGIPLTVLWLVIGAIYFTLRMGFINLRGFKHAIQVVRGKFDDPDAHGHGEVSHFQALASALSATVGLGNIAGVAIAISVGGPGATFWMIMAGFLGMSSKFAECTLGQKYRQVRPDGRVMGGAMYYLSDGLKGLGMAPLGKLLAVLFAVLCIGGSFGGGNTFQVNQSLNALKESVPFLSDTATPLIAAFDSPAGPNSWLYGLIMTIMVGVVILGGIQRIAATAEKIVPAMCAVYVLGCLFVLGSHFAEIPAAFGTIFAGAFDAKAMYGGFLGVLIQGFKRAAFSNEAGVGSAAIAHSCAKTKYPVREGIVALLEPFIDTIVVCTMTALVIVITGMYDSSVNPELATYIADDNGAGLTSKAFGDVISWFPLVLSVAVMLFAFSTMISWSYYGERCWAYLFGDGSSVLYRVIFLLCTFAGSIVTSKNILNFGDLMILGMAFPNILGVVLLSGVVKRELNDYWGKLKSGEIRETK